MLVMGTVAPGFEPVKALFEKNMRSLKERNAQLCVYVGEQCVVDLWATTINDPEFSAESLINVFSSGKSLESITLAMLAERGLLDFDKPIHHYWPEFSSLHKRDTTVAELMRHEAGLSWFDATLTPESLYPTGLINNSVGAVIERTPQVYPEGNVVRREYHALTRGWIANEIFRRVEPEGRTIGQFLRQEISEPLGIDVFIGVTEDEFKRISPVRMLGLGFQLAQSFIPKMLGRSMELNFFQLLTKLRALLATAKHRSRRKYKEPIDGMRSQRGIEALDSPALARSEIPSAGAKCTARGLAKLAAAMANGGTIAGHRVLSARGHELLHANPVKRPMALFLTDFTQSGLAAFADVDDQAGMFEKGLHRGREGFFGWFGLGGSIFQWHPQKRIGFAYVPTSLNWFDIVNERGKAYQLETMRCVERTTRA